MPRSPSRCLACSLVSVELGIRTLKRELICLLLLTCKYVVSVWRGFLFLWVLGMGYVILLWHSLSLPYNYFENVVLKPQNYLASIRTRVGRPQ